jgi:hypothetical protein
MLSDRPFADRDPIRLSVPAPKGPRSFSAEDLARISREVRAEFPNASPGDNASDAAPAPEKREPVLPAPSPPAAQQRSPDGAQRHPGQPSMPIPDFAALNPGYPPSGEPHRAVRARWRNACDWLELFRICRRACCRHAGRCRGEPVACLRAGVRRAPQPARDFVRSMMQAQQQGVPFEEAFEDLADCHDGYFGWLAGLAAARQRS